MMLRLAFTGAGYISRIHAAAAMAIPDVEITTIVERFPATAQPMMKQFHINNHFETVERLIKAGNVDALVIGSPNFLHASQAISALNAGIHVMVEKPMAMNAQEAYKMMEASHKSRAVLMVAHCWRFDPEVRWLRQQVETGMIGRVIRTKSYGVHESWGPSGWFTHQELAGGGAVADMGVHALDTTRFLLGDPEPQSVYAHIGTYYTNQDVDDTGILMVNWSGGVVSYIEAGWWQPHTDAPEAGTQLYGTLGFGQVFPTYFENSGKKQDPGFPFPREKHMPQSMYDEQMAYFIDCIHNHQAPNPGGMEGWINMKVIDAAYKSAQSGRVIRVE